MEEIEEHRLRAAYAKGTQAKNVLAFMDSFFVEADGELYERFCGLRTSDDTSKNEIIMTRQALAEPKQWLLDLIENGNLAKVELDKL